MEHIKSLYTPKYEVWAIEFLAGDPKRAWSQILIRMSLSNLETDGLYVFELLGGKNI